MKNCSTKKAWRIIEKCLPYNYNSRRYYLRQNERLEIALYEGENVVKKKAELASKYRHQNKFMLWCHNSKGWKQRHL